MQNIYKSKFTGEQIEEILDKANELSDIETNIDVTPSDDFLNSIKIGDTKYKLLQVSVNSTEPTAETINTIKVNAVNYKLPDHAVDYSYLTIIIHFGSTRRQVNSIYRKKDRLALYNIVNGAPSIAYDLKIYKFYGGSSGVKAIGYDYLDPSSVTVLEPTDVSFGGDYDWTTEIQNNAEVEIWFDGV